MGACEEQEGKGKFVWGKRLPGWWAGRPGTVQGAILNCNRPFEVRHWGMYPILQMKS
jgi:hypothetical protein